MLLFQGAAIAASHILTDLAFKIAVLHIETRLLILLPLPMIGQIS